MQAVLLVIAVALSVALYRMLSKGGKTYYYARTQTTSFLSDGSENVTQSAANGSIIITNKNVLVDGQEYCYKPMGGEQQQAVLEYDESGSFRDVRIFLSDGEVQYFIQHAHSVRMA